MTAIPAPLFERDGLTRDEGGLMVCATSRDPRHSCRANPECCEPVEPGDLTPAEAEAWGAGGGAMTLLPEVRGLAPTVTPVGQDILVAVDANPDLLTAPAAARLRASDSLVCARRIGFRLFGTPPDLVDDWDDAKRAKGQAVDRLVKQVLRQRHGAITDVAFDFLPDVPLEGFGDAVYPAGGLGVALGEGPDVAVEVKSTTTKKLMGLVGNWRNTPAGPDAGYICQAALLALARGCDRIHVIVVASDLDPTCPRPPAEWVIGLDEDLVHLPVAQVTDDGEIISETPRRLAERELRRQHLILQAVREGRLPRRELPGYGLVLFPPARSRDGADPWACRWCPWQPSCSKLAPGAVPDWKHVAA